MEYGQFCPVAKATEIIGEKWTILIIRELLMGGCRFNDLQRGLSLISPTLLSKRLDSLVDRGLVMKKKISGQRGYEYYPTKSCKDLLPIIVSLGNWGMDWARSNLTEKDYDIELLMIYLERSVIPDNLPGETVISFKFVDIERNSKWWIVVKDGEKDLCNKDPGKDIDVYFTTDVKTMADIWMGDNSYKKALKDKSLKIIGHPALTRNITDWMSDCRFAGLPSAKEI